MVELPDLSPHDAIHSHLDPRATCPGPVRVTGQRGSRRLGWRDEWTCQRCGVNNRPGWANRRTDRTQAAQLIAEYRPMKLRLCVHRKVGAPNYGSDGAGAELEIDLDDDDLKDPAKLVSASRLWYGALERAVDDQVAQMAAKRAQPTAAVEAPRTEVPGPWNDRDGQPTHQAPPAGLEEYGYGQAGGGEVRNGSGSSNGNGYGNGNGNGYGGGPPSRRNGAGGGSPNGSPPRNDPPRNGKQLIGWANGHGKYDDLMRLAKAWNLGKIIEWTPDDVAGAFHELSRPASAGWGPGRN